MTVSQNNMFKNILISHSGKQHSYHVAKALKKGKSLSKFVTSGYVKSKILQYTLNRSRSLFWKRRFLEGLNGKDVAANWRFEFNEFFIRKIFGKKNQFQNAVYSRDVKFDKELSKNLGKYSFDTFWGFQGSSFESLRAAQKLGRLTIYESSSICYKEIKEIIKEEQNKLPEWDGNFLNANFPENYEHRLENEPKLANYIVVASNYSKSTYIKHGFAPAQLLQIPLGFNKAGIVKDVRTKPHGKLKVLYAGSISQSKGIKYLLDAIKKIDDPNITLHCIGHIQGDKSILKPYSDHFKHIPPISQDELFKLYANYDLLVNPSLFEGFGLVILEALAAGTPVIGTANSFAPEIIQDGENGFVVPIRDTETLIKKIVTVRDLSPEDYKSMRKKAIQSVEPYSWEKHITRTINTLDLIRQVEKCFPSVPYTFPKILLSHSGKQHSYHVAKGLKDLNGLALFVTSGYVKSKLLQNFFNKTNNTFWKRRFLSGIHGHDVARNWIYEIKEFLYRKFFGKKEKFQNAVYERDEKFDKKLSLKLQKYGSEFDYFWGFQGSCLYSINEAKKIGKKTICELSIAHIGLAKKILEEEKKLHPEWASTIDNLVFPPVYEKRLYREPIDADRVVAASQFTKMSLLEEGIPEEKIRTLPLGVDIAHIRYNPNRKKQNGKLKILYAGTVTQRKGVKYLFDAVKELDDKNIQLDCIGNIHGNQEVLEPYTKHVNFRGAISQHELFERYTEYDCLILPSLFEGFGLVLAEAMAAGLPIVATAHTMAPDLINEGQSGYIVPIRNVKALQEKIVLLQNMPSNQFNIMSINARKAAESLTWENYNRNLESLLKSL